MVGTWDVDLCLMRIRLIRDLKMELSLPVSFSSKKSLIAWIQPALRESRKNWSRSDYSKASKMCFRKNGALHECLLNMPARLRHRLPFFSAWKRFFASMVAEIWQRKSTFANRSHIIQSSSSGFVYRWWELFKSNRLLPSVWFVYLQILLLHNKFILFHRQGMVQIQERRKLTHGEHFSLALISSSLLVKLFG